MTAVAALVWVVVGAGLLLTAVVGAALIVGGPALDDAHNYEED